MVPYFLIFNDLFCAERQCVGGREVLATEKQKLEHGNLSTLQVLMLTKLVCTLRTLPPTSLKDQKEIKIN